jgi:peptidyl-prolyl cis-trans isomerase A (cyclophilin A)
MPSRYRGRGVRQFSCYTTAMRSLNRFVLPSVFAIACSSSSTTPTSSPPSDAGAADVSTPPAEAAAPTAVDAQLAGCTRDPGATPPTVDPNAPSDPTGGAAKFTLDQALAGFPSGAGKLVALISTEQGFIRCELAESAAPITVANFVGLARGTRPYLDAKGKWAVGRFYDGLIWHRVVPDFVIQGGDPDGFGTGGPGYDLVDENHVDEPLGTLAQAAGKTPSGSQFYVVVGTGPAANYNVFGTCNTEAAIAIANVPRDGSDKPTTDVHMQRIDIARCP